MYIPKGRRVLRLSGTRLIVLLHFVHCLLEVGNDVVHVLNANGEAYEVGRDSCLAQLFFRNTIKFRSIKVLEPLLPNVL